MRMKPDAHDLLATALAAFRADVLPSVPAEKRYTALMIANALAIAEREIAARAGGQSEALTGVYDDIALTAEVIERRFAADIEAGAFDAPGAEREAAFRAVKALNAARLAITNPKLLPGD
jgi:Domain of unknown function (DUF6285)